MLVLLCIIFFNDDDDDDDGVHSTKAEVMNLRLARKTPKSVILHYIKNVSMCPSNALQTHKQPINPQPKQDWRAADSPRRTSCRLDRRAMV